MVVRNIPTLFLQSSFVRCQPNPLSDGTSSFQQNEKPKKKKKKKRERREENARGTGVKKNERSGAQQRNFSACKSFACSNLERVSEYTSDGKRIPGPGAPRRRCCYARYMKRDVSGQSAAGSKQLLLISERFIGWKSHGESLLFPFRSPFHPVPSSYCSLARKRARKHRAGLSRRHPPPPAGRHWKNWPAIRHAPS